MASDDKRWLRVVMSASNHTTPGTLTSILGVSYSMNSLGTAIIITSLQKNIKFWKAMTKAPLCRWGILLLFYSALCHRFGLGLWIHECLPKWRDCDTIVLWINHWVLRFGAIKHVIFFLKTTKKQYKLVQIQQKWPKHAK